MGPALVRDRDEQSFAQRAAIRQGLTVGVWPDVPASILKEYGLDTRKKVAVNA